MKHAKSTQVSLDRRSRLVMLAAALLAAALMSVQSRAHHGWSWAEEKQTELQGTIQSISMSPPHPVLQVNTPEGLWQVDLGNPNQTARSGFTAQSAKVGDAITVLGNRSLEKDKRHMKAVRITVSGKNFDMYPERIGKD
jgi:hypothetical protein